ncbi:MAG: hypothetical protein RIK87_14985 [Fuerstiella sp.]
MPISEPGTTPQSRIPLVTLKDIHPFHGGQSLYLWEDGLFVCQVVKYDRDRQMFIERRFQKTITQKAMKGLSDLLDKHNFFDIVTEQRAGIPEETRPAITVTMTSGKTKTVAKWANEKHPDFDAIYVALRKLITDAEKADPVFDGPYDPKWKPPRMNDE